MNFFRTLFTGGASKPEPSIINGVMPLYIDSERKNSINVIIEERTTCEELIKNSLVIILLYNSSNKSNFNFSLLIVLKSIPLFTISFISSASDFISSNLSSDITVDNLHSISFVFELGMLSIFK